MNLPSPSVTSEFAIDAAAASADQLEPTVTELSDTYLVAWRDKRSDDGDVFAARVSAAGAVLDGTPIVVSGTADVDVAPRLARVGDRFFAVFSRGSDLRGVAIESSGAISNPGGTSLGLPEESLGRYQLAGSSGGGMLAYAFDDTSLRKVATWSVSTGGVVNTPPVVHDSGGIGSNTTLMAPAVADYGSQFLLAITASNPSFGNRVVQVLDGAGNLVTKAWEYNNLNPDTPEQIALAGGPGGFEVAWTEQAVLPFPTLLGWYAPGFSGPASLGETEGQSIVAVGNQFLMTFRDTARSGKPLMGMVVEPSGSRSALFDIQSSLDSWSVRCATQVGCLVVYSRTDGATKRVFGRIVDFGLQPPGDAGTDGGTGGSGGTSSGGASTGGTSGSGGASSGGASTGGTSGSGGASSGGASTGGTSNNGGAAAGGSGAAGSGAASSGGSGASGGEASDAGANGGASASASSDEGGCSTSPNSSSAGWPWLVLALGLFRRRRSR